MADRIITTTLSLPYITPKSFKGTLYFPSKESLNPRLHWVAVKELKLSHHNPETPLLTVCSYYGILIQVPYQQPSLWLGFLQKITKVEPPDSGL